MSETHATTEAENESESLNDFTGENAIELTDIKKSFDGKEFVLKRN